MKTHPLKKQYKITLELSLFCALCIVILGFHSISFNVQTGKAHGKFIKDDFIIVELTDQHIKRLSPPSRPVIPMAVSDDPLIADETIDSTDIDPNVHLIPKIKIPPPPINVHLLNEVVDFIDVEEKPELIGGPAAMQKYLKYPEMARMAKIEGMVVIQILLDESGNVIHSESLSGADMYGFSKAAMDALHSCQFKPAKQRDKTVRCRMNIPVRFRLR